MGADGGCPRGAGGVRRGSEVSSIPRLRTTPDACPTDMAGQTFLHLIIPERSRGADPSIYAQPSRPRKAAQDPRKENTYQPNTIQFPLQVFELSTGVDPLGYDDTSLKLCP